MENVVTQSMALNIILYDHDRRAKWITWACNCNQCIGADFIVTIGDSIISSIFRNTLCSFSLNCFMSTIQHG